MKEERSSGIILRTRPLTETSLIVHWLTPGLGRLATVAKGARRPKSPFRGKLDLFHLAEFSFVRSRRSDLHTLREAVLCRTHPALRLDLARLRQAAYAVALLELSTEAETPLPVLFELLRSFLEQLDQYPARVSGLLAFEVRLLQDLGLSPQTEGALPEGATQLLGQLLSADWTTLSTLAPSPAPLRALATFLPSFLIRHLGRVPRGRPEALQASAR